MLAGKTLMSRKIPFYKPNYIIKNAVSIGILLTYLPGNVSNFKIIIWLKQQCNHAVKKTQAVHQTHTLQHTLTYTTSTLSDTSELRQKKKKKQGWKWRNGDNYREIIEAGERKGVI